MQPLEGVEEVLQFPPGEGEEEEEVLPLQGVVGGLHHQVVGVEQEVTWGEKSCSAHAS